MRTPTGQSRGRVDGVGRLESDFYAATDSASHWRAGVASVSVGPPARSKVLRALRGQLQADLSEKDAEGGSWRPNKLLGST